MNKGILFSGVGEDDRLEGDERLHLWALGVPTCQEAWTWQAMASVTIKKTPKTIPRDPPPQINLYLYNKENLQNPENTRISTTAF